MKYLTAGAVSALMATASAVSFAAVYKCDQGGAIFYQQQPCTTAGAQEQETKWSEDRRRETAEAARRSEEDVRAKAARAKEWDQETAELEAFARDARTKPGVDGRRLQLYLKGLMEYQVEKAFGLPASTQRFGEKELRYYSLWVQESGKSDLRKVQIVIDRGSFRRPAVNNTTWGNVVSSVNIY